MSSASVGVEAGSRVSRLIRQGGGVALSLAAALYVYTYFEEARWQPLVDIGWLVSVAAWLIAFWRSDVPSVPRLRHPYPFYALYALALLSICTNWRWTMSGDTLGWTFMGIDVAGHGLRRSILSVNGPDQFSYLQMLIHNAFMFIAEPTIFWHRVGKIVVALSAAAAIYTVFARMVRPAFGLLVTACTVSCSVWIVYSFSAFPYYDGVASAFALLAIALWIDRDPHSRRAWLALGGLSGFMLYLTMNGWFMALCVWTWLTLRVLMRQLPATEFLLAGVTGLIVGWPALYQWLVLETGAQFSLVEDPHWSIQRVLHFLQETAYMPFASKLWSNGAFGPQLPLGFRWLVIPGILLTVPLRRFPWARFVFLILAVHVVCLAFTQGPYDYVSPKRAIILIPLVIFFVFLPVHSYLRSTWAVVPIALLWASFGIYDIAARVRPGIVGYTLLDGVVEAHQRFSDAERVCVYLPGDLRAEALQPGSNLDRLYQLTPHVVVTTDAALPECRDAICYCSQQHCQHVDLAELGYTKVEMLNSVELSCGRRADH